MITMPKTHCFEERASITPRLWTFTVLPGLWPLGKLKWTATFSRETTAAIKTKHVSIWKNKAQAVCRIFTVKLTTTDNVRFPFRQRLGNLNDFKLINVTAKSNRYSDPTWFITKMLIKSVNKDWFCGWFAVTDCRIKHQYIYIFVYIYIYISIYIYIHIYTHTYTQITHTELIS